MGITFQHAGPGYPTNDIHVSSPTTSILIQDLLNLIREEEASVRGIAYKQIAVATGKDALGGLVATGITLRLLENWKVEWYVGDYVATVDGGNLVADSGNPFFAVVGGPQIEITRSAAATVVTTGGSALTPEEHNKLMVLSPLAEIEASTVLAKQDKVDFLKKHLVNQMDIVSNPDGTKTVIYYDDNGTTEIARHTFKPRHTATIERREKSTI